MLWHLIQGRKNQPKVNSATKPRNPFFWFLHEIQPRKAMRFFQLATNQPNILNLVFYSIWSQDLLRGKVLQVGNRTRCEEPLLVTEGRLAQRSFSSSSITWFIALFSQVSTDTPICFSRSRRASAFSLTIWGNKHTQVRILSRLLFAPCHHSNVLFPDQQITEITQIGGSESCSMRKRVQVFISLPAGTRCEPRDRGCFPWDVKLQAQPLSQDCVLKVTI